jgi:hypothetical protein
MSLFSSLLSYFSVSSPDSASSSSSSLISSNPGEVEDFVLVSPKKDESAEENAQNSNLSYPIELDSSQLANSRGRLPAPLRPLSASIKPSGRLPALYHKPGERKRWESSASCSSSRVTSSTRLTAEQAQLFRCLFDEEPNQHIRVH